MLKNFRSRSRIRLLNLKTILLRIKFSKIANKSRLNKTKSQK